MRKLSSKPQAHLIVFFAACLLKDLHVKNLPNQTESAVLNGFQPSFIRDGNHLLFFRSQLHVLHTINDIVSPGKRVSLTQLKTEKRKDALHLSQGREETRIHERERAPRGREIF